MRIVVLLYEGMTALDAIGPYEVLRNIPNAEVCFVAQEAGPVLTDSKVLSLVANHTLSTAPPADIIVVPGGTAGTFAAAKNEAILDWLRRAHTTSSLDNFCMYRAAHFGRGWVAPGVEGNYPLGRS